MVLGSGIGKLATGERPAAEAEKACHVPSKMKAASGGRAGLRETALARPGRESGMRALPRMPEWWLRPLRAKAGSPFAEVAATKWAAAAEVGLSPTREAGPVMGVTGWLTAEAEGEAGDSIRLWSGAVTASRSSVEPWERQRAAAAMPETPEG